MLGYGQQVGGVEGRRRSLTGCKREGEKTEEGDEDKEVGRRLSHGVWTAEEQETMHEMVYKRMRID